MADFGQHFALMVGSHLDASGVHSTQNKTAAKVKRVFIVTMANRRKCRAQQMVIRISVIMKDVLVMADDRTDVVLESKTHIVMTRTSPLSMVSDLLPKPWCADTVRATTLVRRSV